MINVCKEHLNSTHNNDNILLQLFKISLLGLLASDLNVINVEIMLKYNIK